MKRLRFICPLFLIGFTFPAFGQGVPNGGFETWKSVLGADLPAGWFTSSATVPGTDTYPVVRSTDKQEGEYAIRLETVKTNSMGNEKITQGMAVTGKIDLSKGVQIGFPLTYQPEKLVFHYKYAPVFNDSMSIFITIKKQGEAVPVGYAGISSPQTVDQFTQMELTIDYTSTTTPDSAIIYMFSGQDTMHEGSLLIVDEMHFEGGNSGIKDGNGTASTFGNPYPNPSTGGLVYFPARLGSAGVAHLVISDVNGKVLAQQDANLNAGIDAMSFNARNLRQGVYCYRISAGANIRQGKLIIGQ